MQDMVVAWAGLSVVETERSGRRAGQQDLAVGWMGKVRKGRFATWTTRR